ncbi:disease resistance protein RGA2-like [Phragmites australis]|uniref:disease resistance protein RGA2-like n=1 Tax=Phragmites australis TaxID=29695 RepID=UPI002D79E7C4|nr:disease resistance protein RGA2-like [Phragmites australis]
MALVPSAAAGSGALQVFASHVGLGDGVIALEEKLRNASLVLGAARQIEIKNEALVESLPELQHLVYDAEEVLDEINYFRMQTELDADMEMLDETDIDDCLCDADVEMLDEAEDCVRDDDINGGSDGSSDNSDVSNLVDIADVAEHENNALVPACRHSIVRATRRVEFDKDEILPQICEISRSLGQFTNDVCKALELEELDHIALAKRGTENKRRLTTPYLTEARIYGRDLERDQIVELLMGDERREQNLAVLPIVGNGGIGKTALAQYVCSDPRVEAYFDTMIWVCVSLNFDIVRLTRQMLECITGRDQGGSANLTLLQGMLKEEVKGCRVLLVLDDIWDIKDSSEWSRLVAPLGFNQQGKGSVILVTTRSQSVAKAVCTLNPIALDGLKKEDFWECFRAYAFGKEKGNKKLYCVGRQIADMLKGYPLAAKSVGGLLRKNINFDRWTRIFESKEWISHQDTDGIISILKISYDYLPFHLRRCFSYCSLFPKSNQIYVEDLVYLWISQGFVYPVDNNRRLEEVGFEYLDDLVNLGFFEKVDEDRADIHYLMHDLMHDLAQGVSSKECFIIDGSQCQPMPSTICHLSIIASSQYSDFEKDLVELDTVQRKKLKSLMLFGSFGSTFVTRFHFMANVICNLRSLRISGIEDDGDIISGFGHCIHLRYLRATRQESDKHNPWLERYDRHFPKELCRLYRLQFLNVGVDCYLSNLTKSFSSLVNLRHFICHEENHSELSVSKLASLQELRQFKVRKEAGFQMAQLANLSELDSLSIFCLENLKTKEEASSARLLDREHLRSLCLSWDASRICANPDIEKEVLDGLQPHAELNHLQISGYRSASPPTWLGEASPLIHLQSIYLEDCLSLRTLPPFVHLKCLKKLHLSRICGTPEVLTRSLEELVIEEVEELERWVIGDKFSLLASELQVLEIKGCPKLRELPLSCCSSTQTVSVHLFPLLHRFIIHDCPLLMPLPPLPLGPKVLRMTIVNVGSPLYQSLSYYQFKSLSYYQTLILVGTEKLITPNGVLSLHNLGALSELSLISCSNLTWFSWDEAFQQLKSVKKLNFEECPKLLSMPSAQEQYYKKDHPLPALEKLTIESSYIRGNRLAHVLSHLPSLSYLELRDCPGEAGDECMLLIPLDSFISLKELCITNCVDLSCGNNKGFTGLTSLETLRIGECPKLLSSLIPDEMEEESQSLSRSILLPLSLQRLVLDGISQKLLPLSSLTSLKDLGITESSDLESLDLHACTALEEIRIHCSGALSSVKGLQTCISLRSLEVYGSPGFWLAWSHAMQELVGVNHDVLYPQLERIWTDDLSLLTSCCCKYLQSLEWLGFLCFEDDGDDDSTMEEPYEAFPLLTSLQELNFDSYKKLRSLPATLHLLPSLKKLAIKSCESIASLEELALPASLEELYISGCESLQSLPEKLNYLPSFKKLEISRCPGILSLKEQHLPSSLEEIVIEYCDNLQSLPDTLHLLSSLIKLDIKSCPSIKSMPERGLPPALRELWVWDCNEELKKQCANIRNIKRTLHICF